MNPVIRIVVVMGALAGACLVARAAWPALQSNLTALRSWRRTVGEVRAMSDKIEFEIGREPDSSRAFAVVDHTWGLQLFHKAPLFLDPADPARVKPAGFLQMWLTPAGMSAFFVLFLAIAWVGANYGTGQDDILVAGAPTQARWIFSQSPGPLPSAVTLHAPPRQWKIILGWSLLGVAMAVFSIFAKGGNPLSRVGYITLGTAYALALWAFAWHTSSLEVSANDRGIRMTSVLGWREVPWNRIRSVEDQDIFTTYYNGKMKMWELPFPGNTIRVLAFTDERGFPLMTLSPELQPADSLHRLFALCTEQTGLKLHHRTIAIKY
jgi:hypothetical protein